MVHKCWRDQTRDFPVERQPRQDQDVAAREETRDFTMKRTLKTTWSFYIFHSSPCLSVSDRHQSRAPQRSLKYLILYTVGQSIILLWCIFRNIPDLTLNLQFLYICETLWYQAWMERKLNDRQTVKVIADGSTSECDDISSCIFDVQGCSGIAHIQSMHNKLSPKTHRKSAWLFSVYVHTLTQITPKSTWHVHTLSFHMSPDDTPRQQTHAHTVDCTLELWDLIVACLYLWCFAVACQMWLRNMDRTLKWRFLKKKDANAVSRGRAGPALPITLW